MFLIASGTCLLNPKSLSYIKRQSYYWRSHHKQFMISYLAKNCISPMYQRKMYMHAIDAARQLSENTYWCDIFASKLLEIYANVPKAFCDPLTIFMVDHHFYPVPVSHLYRECWFSPLPQTQRGTLVLITFSCESSLYASNHSKPRWQLWHPISCLKLLKILFSSQVPGFLRRICRELMVSFLCPSPGWSWADELDAMS